MMNKVSSPQPMKRNPISMRRETSSRVHRHYVNTRRNVVPRAGVEDGLLSREDLGVVELARQSHRGREIVRTDECRVDTGRAQNGVGLGDGIRMFEHHDDQNVVVMTDEVVGKVASKVGCTAERHATVACAAGTGPWRQPGRPARAS